MTFILLSEGQIMLILCKPPSVLLWKITISHLLKICTKEKKKPPKDYTGTYLALLQTLYGLELSKSPTNLANINIAACFS